MSLSKNINPGLVLVQYRKTRSFITEKLLMGLKESNQTNKKFFKATNTFVKINGQGNIHIFTLKMV